MKLISPSNREVDIGQTLAPNEYIGMTRREVLDTYLRDRAISFGAKAINALVTEVTAPKSSEGKYAIVFTRADSNQKEKLEFDYVIGAAGANSRVAKAMGTTSHLFSSLLPISYLFRAGAGEYNYAIAFQERIKISDEKMKFYEELAEMYVGDDVSPDFYGWVFPKYDHVGVGTGTVVNRPAIKQYQKAMRDRCAEKIAGGESLSLPIPLTH